MLYLVSHLLARISRLLSRRMVSVLLMTGTISVMTSTSAGWCSSSQVVMPVFEVEPILDGMIPVHVSEKSPESQLSALEIMEEAYQLYLSDRLDGMAAAEAQEHLIETLQAIGFEAQSAKTLLKSLENGTYEVPDALKQALEHISQL